MGDLLILIPILLFTGFVIVKKIKAAKDGKSCCSSSCDGCSKDVSCK